MNPRLSFHVVVGFLAAALLPVFAVALSATDQICSIQSNLARGSHGNDVVILQNFLKAQGTFNAGATGYFGPLTEAALANWQLNIGIIASITEGGIFGPRTRKHLRSKGCPMSVSQVQLSPTVTLPPATKTQETARKTCTPPPAPNLSCEGYWEKTYGAKGCQTGWTCVTVKGSSAATPVNQSPLISAISGPTKLEPGQGGIWTIIASDPEKDPIEYSIVWGDEGSVLPQLLDVGHFGLQGFSSQTSYSHTYKKPGAYTIVVFARDTANNDTRATFSLIVESPPPPPPSTPMQGAQQSGGGVSGTSGGGATCTDNGQTFSDGQTQCHIVPGAITGSVTCPQQNLWTCRNGQWVSGMQTQSTTASCTAIWGAPQNAGGQLTFEQRTFPEGTRSWNCAYTLPNGTTQTDTVCSMHQNVLAAGPFICYGGQWVAQ